VDAISAFLADELDMEALGAAAVITGSQKALAVQPGISVVALAPAALERVAVNPEVCMYLSLKDELPCAIHEDENGIIGELLKFSETKEEMQNSKYNSYNTYGFIPGPISNPGFEAISAAFYPDKTNYMYFFSYKDGTTKYSKSLDEHQNAVAKAKSEGTYATQE
jgi:hypothetical protein